MLRCVHCGAIHWIEERLGTSSKENPKFRCCQDGKIKIPPVTDTPQELRNLLSETYVNARVHSLLCYTEVNAQGERLFTVRTSEFMRRIRAYNNAVSFTSFGAKMDDTILNNAHNVYTMRVCGEVWHRLGSLFREEGKRPQQSSQL